MICEDCGKELTNEEDCYGHDCEAGPMKHKKEFWVMSILSDVQEMVDRFYPAHEINNKINDAKRVLMGKYVETDGGFSIQILRGKK